MTRELKFRAWHKETKRLLDGETLLQMLRVEHDNGVAEGRLGMKARIGVDNEREYYSHLEFMQYTGLKDKNGKEIYEGDILGIMNPTKAGMCWEVTWHDFGWQILLRNFDNPAPYYVRAGKHLAEQEVIGNIYENKELLEAK